MTAQSRVLEEELRRLHIPYRIVGGKSFFDRREVKDLIAYMTLLVNPAADASLLRIVNTPARGISDVTVELALRWSVEHKCSVWQALRSSAFVAGLSQRTGAAVQRFIDLVNDYRARLAGARIDPASVLGSLIQQIDYSSELRRSCKSIEEATEREG